MQATPSCVLIDPATWAKEKDKWLPSVADGDFIASLMKPVSVRIPWSISDTPNCMAVAMPRIAQGVPLRRPLNLLRRLNGSMSAAPTNNENT